MNRTRNLLVSMALAACLGINKTCTTAAAEEGSSLFTQLSGDFGDVTEIDISPSCEGVTSGTVPNLVWTIVPTTTTTLVEVFTSPADLFAVSSSGGGKLSFAFNPDVASNAKSGGGVRISVPADKLQKVSVGGAHTAQILDGFQTVTQLTVQGASTLTATFTSTSSSSSSNNSNTVVNNDAISLLVEGASSVTIIATSSNLSGGSISGASTVRAETPLYDTIDVSGASTLLVKGSVGGGTVNGASTITANDSNGSIAASGASTVNLSSLSNDGNGSIAASGASTVNLSSSSSCDSVTTTGASSCNIVNDNTITVEVSMPSLGSEATGTGSSRCYGGWLPGFWGGSSSSAPGSTSAGIHSTVVLAGGVVVAAACLL